MEYKEAAEILASIAICTFPVPIGCKSCPAFKKITEDKKQLEVCTEIRRPGNVAEAIGVVIGYMEASAKKQ